MRVFVVGLDGATWTALNPLMAEGHMPCLGALCARGARGVLRSTWPPITAVAWTSFQTGVHPGKHGLYGFQRIARTPQGLHFSIADASHIRARPLWSSLAEAGKSVIIVNLPMTYPPSPVPGLLVTGFPTPSQRSPFTYPPELKREVLRAAPTYRVPTLRWGGCVLERQIPKFVAQLLRMVDGRAQAAQHLMHHHPWDLFILQFQETDLLQHPLWHHLDPRHPYFSPAMHRRVARVFQRLDEHLQAIVDSLREDDMLVILSDHGFQAVERTFYPNLWLVQRGWLSPYREGKSLKGQTLKALKKVDFLRLRNLLPSAILASLKNDYVPTTFDWEESRAYADADHTGCFGLYLLQGEAPTELVSQLEELQDPDTGAPVVARVLRAEEAFGPQPVAGAPDYLVELGPGYAALPEAPALKSCFGNRLPEEAYQVGVHHPEGIFVFVGPGVKAQNDLQANIVDVAPTLLGFLNGAVPSSMDGQVLLEVLEPEMRNRLRGRLSYGKERGKEGQQEEGRRGLSPEEEEVVKEQLQDLGYL